MSARKAIALELTPGEVADVVDALERYITATEHDFERRSQLTPRQAVQFRAKANRLRAVKQKIAGSLTHE